MAYDADQDHGPPPAKRRGSTFDMRISQLSLYDQRRHSVHSIHSLDSSSKSSGLGGAPSWATRRDSAASLYSDTSLGSQSTSASLYPQDSGLPNPGHSWRSSSSLRLPIPDSESNDIPPVHNCRTLPAIDSVVEETGMSPGSGPRPSLPPLTLLASPNADSPNGGHRQLQGPQDLSQRRMSVSDIISKNGRDGTRFKPVGSRPSIPLNDTHSSTGHNVPSVPSRGSFQESSGVSNTNLTPNGNIAMKHGESPYSRSPELRVSHKLAERKRRKEMKELFDELRDQLPEDRTMKASKWEILTKCLLYSPSHSHVIKQLTLLISVSAVEYIGQLKRAFEYSQTELEAARREVAEVTGKPYQPPNNDLLHSLPIDIMSPSHFIPSSSSALPTRPQHPSETSPVPNGIQRSLADPLLYGNARPRDGREREGVDGRDEEEGTRERLSSSTTTCSGDRTPETSTREPEEESPSP